MSSTRQEASTSFCAQRESMERSGCSSTQGKGARSVVLPQESKKQSSTAGRKRLIINYS